MHISTRSRHGGVVRLSESGAQVAGRHPGAIARFAPLLLLLFVSTASAEDGYRLWLRNAAVDGPGEIGLAGDIRVATLPGLGTTGQLAAAELASGLGEMLGRQVPVTAAPESATVVLATAGQVADEAPSLSALGDEGFRASRVAFDGRDVVLLAANTEVGLLYGAFAVLRHLQTGHSLDAIDIEQQPKVGLRLLNHWDNLNRHVERGYAGQSIWDWWRLPGYVDPRYTDYARANASIGINGTVLNNVNANAQILTPRYLEKVRAIAEVLRPWGIRVYLSARFSAPVEIGGLETADPLDHDVRAWWAGKADEIYALIPDFGGFLVKANSEGQPGPQNYGRSHAEGANMLAAAVAPHGGIVMWRAFVYSDTDPEDRIKQAYSEFKPLDGQFADNVMVQVKNGPLDFQPREPFHPMFGRMPDTSLVMEFQVTKEYLGFSTHLAYLGAYYEEVLDADTFVEGSGSTVARVIEGEVYEKPLTGIAGVANIGSDRDWSGSPFDQANWYAYGRLAWDPELSSRSIAEEWLKQTFSRDPGFVQTVADMMMRSREAVVDYMTPLGLTHIMGTGHHYGPAPWVSELDRPEWNPVYYHRADGDAIGFDRTASGSNAVSQYAEPLATRFSTPATTPESLLLWFHRLPWDYELESGMTLWEGLLAHYDRGVSAVEGMQRTWAEQEAHVDPQRFKKISSYLAIQAREAKWWRDACIAYFMEVSGEALPRGVEPPEHSLDFYRGLEFPNAPGN